MAAGTGESVQEHIRVEAPPLRAYQAVADVRGIARWSPECFAVWVYRRREGSAERFVGFNRRGPFMWFTTCRVVIADHGREFAFDVTTFGQPVSRWGYRFAPDGAGTRVTEYWVDHRSRAAFTLGRIFTGRSAGMRPAVNAEGMRRTLGRLKLHLEADSASAAA